MWHVDVRHPEHVTQSRWPQGIFVAQPGLGGLWLLDFAGRRAWRLGAGQD
jgi:hypothetical protein